MRSRRVIAARLPKSGDRFALLGTPRGTLSFIITQGGFMTTYCVVCRGPVVGPMRNSRTMRFYLSEASADRAVVVAAQENPEFRVLGIEPGGQVVVTAA